MFVSASIAQVQQGSPPDPSALREDMSARHQRVESIAPEDWFFLVDPGVLSANEAVIRSSGFFGDNIAEEEGMLAMIGRFSRKEEGVRGSNKD